MNDSVIETYQNRLNDEIESVSGYILKGKCCDHAEYLARISELYAYRRAKDNFQLALKDYIEQEDSELPTMEED